MGRGHLRGGAAAVAACRRPRRPARAIRLKARASDDARWHAATLCNRYRHVFRTNRPQATAHGRLVRFGARVARVGACRAESAQTACRRVRHQCARASSCLGVFVSGQRCVRGSPPPRAPCLPGETGQRLCYGPVPMRLGVRLCAFGMRQSYITLLNTLKLRRITVRLPMRRTGRNAADFGMRVLLTAENGSIAAVCGAYPG